MADWDNQRFERGRAIPDLDHRQSADGSSSGPAQRSGIKVLLGVGVLVVMLFVLLAITDDGSSNNPPAGSSATATTMSVDRV